MADSRPRRYAEDTTVPIAKSRGEIDALLRSWGADGVQWTDEWSKGRIVLRFIWAAGGTRYHARFTVSLPTDELLRKDKRAHNRWGQVVDGKLEKLRAARGRSEHRVLFLWLKAAFNAVDSGLVAAEALFLPFLEDASGQTVAEQIVPRLQQLLTVNADRLLGPGSSDR